ncbi:MAG: CPBP family intramembrane metalloprotease [Atopobiaceae bacterium]|nr:CPBP family intramembrane metalloprotease [Atopobiaceae bacterium]
MTYRSYITQTVSCWSKLPLVGILVQVVAFTVVHPYNIIGMMDIAISALLYTLCCITSKGIEAPTALHIINNTTEIWMTGFGFGAISSKMTFASAAVFLVFKTLFFLFIVFADKKLHWFDEVQYDDVERWNASHA